MQSNFVNPQIPLNMQQNFANPQIDLNMQPIFGNAQLPLNMQPTYANAQMHLNTQPIFGNAQMDFNMQPTYANAHMQLNTQPTFANAQMQLNTPSSFAYGGNPPANGPNIAALQNQIDTLKNENKTLSRENVIVKGFYNMLRGHFDFMIGPEGRLFPIIPAIRAPAVVASNQPKPPIQQVYEAKMERLKREYPGVLLSADICNLCPLHYNSHGHLQAPKVEHAALQFIDLTGDDPEPPPAFRKDSIQEFLARAAREEALGRNNPVGQTIAPVDTTTSVQETATAETTTTAAVPPATQAATTHAGSSQSPAIEPAQRPAPPATPPSEVEAGSPSKRQKRKQSNYGWLQPSQNLALRKATGDLPHPLEEWNLLQAAGGSISEAVAVFNGATTTPATDHQSSSPALRQESAAPRASATPKPSKVTKTKPATPKKSNARGNSKAKPKSSAALSAAFTNALAGSNSVTSSVAKTLGTSSSHNALIVDILPEEPTYMPARPPTPPLPPTAWTNDIDSTDDFDLEYETEEERAARMSDYDLMVIDHNEQYLLPDDAEIPQLLSLMDTNDEDVADLIALLEEPEVHDDHQNKACNAKDTKSDAGEYVSAQDTLEAMVDIGMEASEDKNSGGDENWDVESLFACTEDEVQVAWQDEESEVSEEE